MKHPVVPSCVLLLLLSMLSVAVVLGVRDPYTQIEAESLDFNKGAEIAANVTVSGGKYAGALHPGDHVGYSQLDFSVETAALELQMWNEHDYNLDSQVLLRLDAPDAAPFLTFVIPQGGRRWIRSTMLIPVGQRPRGVRDLYFTFRHPTPTTRVLAIDWFRFVTLNSLLPPSHTLCPEDNKGGKCPVENKAGKCPEDNKPNPNCPRGQSHTHWTTDHCQSPDGKQKQIIINVC